MKVIVAGSRTITSQEVVGNAMRLFEEEIDHIDEVVSGHAVGVDSTGEYLAELEELPIKVFPADWERHGRAAGIVRNEEMACYADGLVAVWDGKSQGTIDMVNRMMRKHKPVLVITYGVK